MKKIILLLWIICDSSKAFSQVAYYDAQQLKKYLNKEGDLKGNDTVFAILDNYVDPSKSNTKAEIVNAFAANPFFAVSGTTQADVLSAKANGIPMSLSSVGGINITNFADGLAKFLVSRAKQELSLAFFKKFKKDLEDPKYIELKTLFPHTQKVLMAVDKDIYQFSIYLNTLREAFIKDFLMLFENLDQLMQLPKYREYFAKDPEIGTLIQNTLYFFGQYSKNTPPALALEHYQPDTYINFKDTVLQTNLRTAIKFTQVVSHSVRSKNASGFWVPIDSLTRLLNDADQRSLYLGLISQQSKLFKVCSGEATFLLDKVFKQLSATSDSLLKFTAFVQNIVSDANALDQQMLYLKNKGNMGGNPDDYYRIFDASLTILKDGFKFTDLPYLDIKAEKKNEIKKIGNKLLNFAGNAGEMYVDVRTKNYSSAIFTLAGIIDSILVRQPEDPNLKQGETTRKLLKYGTFMATVATAQNSDEVQSAIESIALPAGSYSVKRNALWNISLNGYVGLGYDNGNPFGINHTGAVIRDTKNLNWNVSAMLGFAFSSGLCKRHSIGSFSAFLSVIDVGSIANFRISNDSTVLERKITVGDIFSPGLSFIYGIPKVPLSLSAGLVYKPSLAYTSSNGFLNVPGMLRFNISLLVDIPVINIHTRPKD